VSALARRLRRALPDVAAARRGIGRLQLRLGAAAVRGAGERERRIAALRTALGHLDPNQVLARGYSIVRDAGGEVRRSSAGLAAGQPLDVTFAEGGAAVTVREPR
jgi:exodeoxyribonuclease VII large subunit